MRRVLHLSYDYRCAGIGIKGYVQNRLLLFLTKHCYEKSPLVFEHKQRVRALHSYLYNTIIIANNDTQHPDT